MRHSAGLEKRNRTMYLPAHFAEARSEELHRILAENPLGMLVTHGAQGLDANHIPFEFDAARGA